MNNRQNGRRRGRGGNGGGGGQRNPGSPNSGNRIDNRARGNANQLYEKYKNLARDAQMSGDRVNTEYYLQFADHYFRVLSESRARFEEQNPNAAPQRRIQPVDSFDDYGDEDDYADEGEPVRAGEQNGAGEQHGLRGQQGGQREGGRDHGRDGNRYQGRDDQRDEQQRDDHRERGRRHEAQDFARSERGREDNDRYAVTGSPVANDLGEDSPDGAEPTPVAARRRGRPRREAAPVDAPAALDADRLPPSLALAPTTDAVDEEQAEATPRRRRRRAGGGAIAGDVQAG